jgi:hypothetical protein
VLLAPNSLGPEPLGSFSIPDRSDHGTDFKLAIPVYTTVSEAGIQSVLYSASVAEEDIKKPSIDRSFRQQEG